MVLPLLGTKTGFTCVLFLVFFKATTLTFLFFSRRHINTVIVSPEYANLGLFSVCVNQIFVYNPTMTKKKPQVKKKKFLSIMLPVSILKVLR